jgi:hypothetical protein
MLWARLVLQQLVEFGAWIDGRKVTGAAARWSKQGPHPKCSSLISPEISSNLLYAGSHFSLPLYPLKHPAQTC